ncbi:MAG: PadR family transcriptional regulator [Candidatus Omnitrophota bacterium]
MNEQELILLGLLKESPKHGYEIKLRIRQILSLFTGTELKSIYYPLRVLEKKGYVTKRISKMGKRPVRFVYALTSKGQKRFTLLLNKSLLQVKRPQFSLDLSLFFLRYLKSKSSRRRLSARLALLNKISNGMKQMMDTPEVRASHALTHIVQHNLRMLETESEFLNQFIRSL